MVDKSEVMWADTAPYVPGSAKKLNFITLFINTA
jgi:hypothetical protein